MAEEVQSAKASIRIDVPAAQVYDLVADVSNMGRWSPEATGTLGHPHDLKAGDHFYGTNRSGIWRWMTRCTVREADRGRRFSFDVAVGPMPISTWTYDFVDVDGGCEVTEIWTDRRDGLVGKPMAWAGSVIIPGPRAEHNQQGIETTLQRLKEAAEAG